MEGNQVVHENLNGWVKNRVAAETYNVAAALVRGDSGELERLVQVYGSERARQRSSSSLPADPWDDNAVRYGAILALVEFASVSASVAVSPDTLRELLRGRESRDILLTLAGEPGGLIPQADIPSQTGIARSNAHSKLTRLTELELITRRAADRRGRHFTLELTRLGWAAAEALHRLGFEKRSLEVKELLSEDEVWLRLNRDLSKYREIGKELAQLASSDPSAREPVNNLLARGMRELDMKTGIGMFGAFLSSSAEKIGRWNVSSAPSIATCLQEQKLNRQCLYDAINSSSDCLLEEPWLKTAVDACSAEVDKDPHWVGAVLVQEMVVSNGS